MQTWVLRGKAASAPQRVQMERCATFEPGAACLTQLPLRFVHELCRCQLECAVRPVPGSRLPAALGPLVSGGVPADLINRVLPGIIDCRLAEPGYQSFLHSALVSYACDSFPGSAHQFVTATDMLLSPAMHHCCPCRFLHSPRCPSPLPPPTAGAWMSCCSPPFSATATSVSSSAWQGWPPRPPSLPCWPLPWQPASRWSARAR